MTEEELNEELNRIKTDYAHIMNPDETEENKNGKK
jgi:hypothetical protein